MKKIVCFSGGHSSALAAIETMRKYGTEGMILLKVVVWACVLNGFAWIWCSYILAWLDKVQIAETLSTAAVTEIIGAVLAYGLKSLVENLSKNNHWPDKRPADTETTPDQNDTDGGGAVG